MRPTRFLRHVAVAAGGLLASAAVFSPADAQTGGASPALNVDVTAEVVGSAPFSVSATDVTEGDDGLLEHGVVVTWSDAQSAILGDARFTHHVSAEAGEGDLVISGRGCGASWAEAEQEVLFPCTLDLQAFPVSQGESHEYPVWIHPTVGPLALQPGTYVVEQVVSWYRADTEDQQQQATIRLTYDVSEAPRVFDISVAATVLGSGAPVSVLTTPVTMSADGRYSHGVRVTWNGTGTATLDDARFAHHVVAEDGPGDLVTTGRGCGASWNESSGEVVIICTADFQIIELKSGETHQYPVTITPSVGPRQLEPGTYIVDEPISWQPSSGTGGQFTVRLTYTVTEADGPPGVFTPALSPTGVSIASWSGGPASGFPEAKSYWTTESGRLVPYVPGAPAFVNARFLSLFPQQVPAGTLFIVIR